MKYMTLSGAQVGDVVEIQEVGGERAFKRRLMELGLVPGTQVRFLGVAPLGDPLKLEVRGALLSIRHAEAELISVRATRSVAATPSVPAALVAPRSAS
jgi:ferrous iron transport protein A